MSGIVISFGVQSLKLLGTGCFFIGNSCGELIPAGTLIPFLARMNFPK